MHFFHHLYPNIRKITKRKHTAVFDRTCLDNDSWPKYIIYIYIYIYIYILREREGKIINKIRRSKNSRRYVSAVRCVLYIHNHNNDINNNSTTYTYSNTNSYAEKQADSVVSVTNGFINFLLQFFNTRRETQFLKVFHNHTMLTTPPTFGTSRDV